MSFPTDELPPLKNDFPLLLSQAVCKLGSSDWNSVSELLLGGPYPGPRLEFTPEFCSNAFAELVRAEGYDLAKTVTPESRVAQKLAHKFFTLRLHEIVAGLKAMGVKEADLKREIAAINAGEKDKHFIAAAPDEALVVTSALPLPTLSDTMQDSSDRASSRVPSSVAKRRRGRGASEEGRERVEDSESAMGDEAMDSLAVKEEGEDEGGPSSRRGKKGKGRASRTKGDEMDVVDDDQPTPASEMQDDDTEREQSVPAVGKKGSRTKKAGQLTKTQRERERARGKGESEPAEGTPPPQKKRAKTEDQTEEEVKAEKEEKATALRFKRAITNLLETLQNEKDAHPFIHPVARKDAEGYGDVVHRPMCIVDLTRRVKNGTVMTSSEVMRDAALIFANAVQFNGRDDHPVGIQAVAMWAKFEALMTMHMMSEFST